MSQDDGLDRRLTAWLDVEAAPYAPADLRMRFAEGVDRTRQRPAWATTERWISMETRARLGGVPRLVIILATIGLLAALSAGAIVIGSDGPARNGRIAFMYQNDIYTVAPDGSDRRLIVAWRDIKGLRDPDRFEPWLRRLLVNACYREARSIRRRWAVEGQVRPLAGTFADPALAAADHDELTRAFDELGTEQRTLLVLHYHLGLPMHETALALGLPIGTVKSRLHRTTQQLRASLDAHARLPLREERAT